MKSADETIGASTVWVHTLRTRSVSRRISQISPYAPLALSTASVAATAD
jgi:hypothetical protein